MKAPDTSGPPNVADRQKRDVGGASEMMTSLGALSTGVVLDTVSLPRLALLFSVHSEVLSPCGDIVKSRLPPVDLEEPADDTGSRGL